MYKSYKKQTQLIGILRVITDFYDNSFRFFKEKFILSFFSKNKIYSKCKQYLNFKTNKNCDAILICFVIKHLNNILAFCLKL